MDDRYDIDAVNDHLVGMRGSEIAILIPPMRMDRDEALRLAAWIVAIAGDDKRFAEILAAVKAA